MVWSKIKKAINSTLGTSGFKPLDKIITDSFETVVKKQNDIKESLETGNNNFIVDYVKNGANIEKGSYVGTGTAGPSNPTSLTAGFVPQVVIITDIDGFQNAHILVKGMPKFVSKNTNSAGNKYFDVSLLWEGNTVSWYYEKNDVNYAETQLNEKGKTYYYIMLG